MNNARKPTCTVTVSGIKSIIMHNIDNAKKRLDGTTKTYIANDVYNVDT